MEFPDPCVYFLFPGQRVGASTTCPFYSGDDQCCSLHDHCEWRDWTLRALSLTVSWWMHVTRLMRFNRKNFTTGSGSHNPHFLWEILWLYTAREKSEVDRAKPTEALSSWQVILPSLRNLFIPVFLNCWLAKHSLENMIVSEGLSPCQLFILPSSVHLHISVGMHQLSLSLSVWFGRFFFHECTSDAEQLNSHLLLKLFTFPASIYPVTPKLASHF